MPNYLDLFAGAGGLSEGFIQAGFKPVAHVEMDEAACYTLKTRAAYYWLNTHCKSELYEQYISGKITREQLYSYVPRKVLESVLNYEISDKTLPEIFKRIDENLRGKKLDLVIGGPPCQAYSLVGRARSETGMHGDERNYLYKLYAKFLSRYEPKYFVFENVTGLLSAKDEDGRLHFDKMRELFKRCGYSTEYRVLDSHDYGVFQHRKRIILIGKRGKKESGFYPSIKGYDMDGLMVEEIFNDLPFLKAGQGVYTPVSTKKYTGKYLYDVCVKDTNKVTFHVARPNTEQDLKIYEIAVKEWETNKRRIEYTDLPYELKTHNNTTSFLDRFKVVAKDLDHSQTVVAHVSRDGHYYIHPDIKQNRSLTPREVARLQTFPDSYYFESKKGIPGRTAAYKQIGNAVPVRLAYYVAVSMKKLLNKNTRGE